MSTEIKSVIPDQYKNYYDNIQINPNAIDMGFKVKKEMEDIKETVRATSKLYPIFGEKMFGFVTEDVRLHLDIDIFDFTELIGDLTEELNILQYRAKVIKDLGSNSVKINDLNSIKWNSETIYDTIKLDIESIEEAISKVIEIRFDYPLGFVPQSIQKDINGINKMLKMFKLNSLDVHHIQYLKSSLKAKVLDKSIVNINWRYEYFISKQS